MTVTELKELLEKSPPNSKVPLPNNEFGYGLVKKDSLLREGQQAYFIVAPSGRDGAWRLDYTTLRMASVGELHIHD